MRCHCRRLVKLTILMARQVVPSKVSAIVQCDLLFIEQWKFDLAFSSNRLVPCMFARTRLVVRLIRNRLRPRRIVHILVAATFELRYNASSTEPAS